jgi:hypothetical protein
LAPYQGQIELLRTLEEKTHAPIRLQLCPVHQHWRWIRKPPILELSLCATMLELDQSADKYKFGLLPNFTESQRSAACSFLYGNYHLNVLGYLESNKWCNFSSNATKPTEAESWFQSWTPVVIAESQEELFTEDWSMDSRSRIAWFLSVTCSLFFLPLSLFLNSSPFCPCSAFFTVLFNFFLFPKKNFSSCSTSSSRSLLSWSGASHVGHGNYASGSGGDLRS